MSYENILSEIESKEIISGFHGKFIHTQNTTMTFWEVDKGAELPLHHHIHEQTTQIIEGEFEMTINGETKVYKPGSVLVIPSNIPHSGRAITPCKIFDTFYPTREDYK